MQVIVQDRGHMPGIEDLVAEQGPGKVESEMIASVANAVERAELPLPVTMGVWDKIGHLIDWVRGRKLVSELPEAIAYLPWFECHVPHTGAAQVSLTAVAGEDRSVGLKIFGSGLGRGRALKLAISSDTESRTACAVYSVAVRLSPKVYVMDGKESIVLDLAGEAGARVVTLGECERCAVAPEAVDPFDYVMGNFIDLRQDNVKHKMKINLEWKESNSFEIGLSLPGIKIPLTLAVNAQASTASTWEVMYQFAPGFFYQPYRKLTGASYQPPMWAFKQ